MSKRTILSAIFILSVLVGAFGLINSLRLIYEFKSNIIEFTTPFELKVESGNGRYDLFVMSSKSDEEDGVDCLNPKDILSSIAIKTKDDTRIVINKKSSNLTYILFDNVYRNIGSFETDGEQTIRIESNSKNVQFEKLAYAREGLWVRIFGLMKYGLLLLLSVGVGLISGISLIILKRNKSVIANIAE